jgi:trehalose synthase
MGERPCDWIEGVAPLKQVFVPPQAIERFRALLGEGYEEFATQAIEAKELFAGRVIWNVNSTARGGGVAEMLRSHLAYVRAIGIDVRWMVVGDGPEFFEVTKRIHNNLHGVEGDGGPLGDHERQVYEGGLAADASRLCRLVRPGDVAFLHDPQTLGLVAPLRSAGARVLWRSHIGVDRPNAVARAAWGFLMPYAEQAEAMAFSRRQYAWEGLDPAKVAVVPPSIDPFSPKNQELDGASVRSILAVTGIGPDAGASAATFARTDGTPGRVDRPAAVFQQGPVPEAASLVTQVSRWDRLKGPVGILDAFERHFAAGDEHLLLAGPDVARVVDDPEGATVLQEIVARRESLPEDVRARTHLATLPLDDIEENAATVNAIQRRSDVIVQNSLAEGFGLTVSEAMWKETPVVATRVGGIQDQIVDGQSGLLIEPGDSDALAGAIRTLLEDRDRAAALGRAAHERVAAEFLVTGRLTAYFRLFERLLEAG